MPLSRKRYSWYTNKCSRSQNSFGPPMMINQIHILKNTPSQLRLSVVRIQPLYLHSLLIQHLKICLIRYDSIAKVHVHLPKCLRSNLDCFFTTVCFFSTTNCSDGTWGTTSHALRKQNIFWHFQRRHTQRFWGLIQDPLLPNAWQYSYTLKYHV